MSYGEIKYTSIARKLLKSIYEGYVTLLDIKAFNKADTSQKKTTVPQVVNQPQSLTGQIQYGMGCLGPATTKS